MATAEVDRETAQRMDAASYGFDNALLRRALMHAAHEASGQNNEAAIARMICWIICADEELKHERAAVHG